jgi:peroxiredoxin
MAIRVGDRLPLVTLRKVTPEGPQEVTTAGFFAHRKVAVFAVPGAFASASSQQHLPNYVAKAGELMAKGIDEIACVAVHDPAVLGAWGRDRKSEGKVTMLADGNADFVRAVGLELDLAKEGFGIRAQRFAMLVEDGIVKTLHIDATPSQVTASRAESILLDLEGKPPNVRG